MGEDPALQPCPVPQAEQMHLLGPARINSYRRDCVCVCLCAHACACSHKTEQSQEQGPQRCHDACPAPSCLLISFLQCDLPLSSRDLPHLCPKTGPQLSPRPGLRSPYQPSLTSSSTPLLLSIPAIAPPCSHLRTFALAISSAWHALPSGVYMGRSLSPFRSLPKLTSVRSLSSHTPHTSYPLFLLFLLSMYH